MQGIILLSVAVISFLISAVSGKFLIPFLRRLKFGQTIKEIGPTWHKKKQGTPTMGGIMFILATVLATVAGYFTYISVTGEEVNSVETIRLFAGLCLAILYGFMGFVDDYISVIKKRNLGLKASQKLIIQVLIALAYLLVLRLSGAVSTIIDVPFISTQFNLGILYYPIMVFVIVGTANAVNLTDGIDGLAGSVTFIVCVSFIMFAAKLALSYTGIFAAAAAAALLGFLVWNFYPAKVIMGDTGSMFLGGTVVAFAFLIDMPIIIILVGIIYFIEALSVILQVISFKTTGKRIFKMSPIHHHFELCNWSEIKIVTVFSIVTALFCVISYFGI